MPLEELKRRLVELSAEEFVSHYLLEPTPHMFAGDPEGWIRWKSALAHEIAIDPRNITVIGSACLGRSLNPEKNFSEFHEESDIDVAAVSAFHFDMAWRELRAVRLETLGVKKQSAVKAHRTNYVYWGTIATDMCLSLLSFGRAWERALTRARAHPAVKYRDVKIRLYRDFDSLRSYHVANVRSLRNTLAAPLEDDIELA